MPFLLRRRQDTHANWVSTNPVVPNKQLVFTINAGGSGISLFKIGDGVSNWASLPYINKRNNFNAATNPTVTDDINSFYTVGSMWSNKATPATPLVYICTDSSVGAAVWAQTNAGGGGAVDSVTQGTGVQVTGTAADPIVNLSAASIASLSKADSALQNITGLISDGTNVTITGTGTGGDPYAISASGGGTPPDLTPYTLVDGTKKFTGIQKGQNAVEDDDLIPYGQVEGLIDPPCVENNWTYVSVQASNWCAIVRINNRLVAVADSGTNRVMYSDDEGETWTFVLGISSGWKGITKINSRLVAVASNSTNKVMYSDDEGENWTGVSVLTSQWNSIIEINGRLVSVSNNGTNQVMYSDDEGENWTYVTVETSSWTSIAKINNRLVAIASGGTNQVMYSDDEGETWTFVIVDAYPWTSIVVINNRLVAASQGDKIMYSDDEGETWTYVPVELSGWKGLTKINSRLVAVGDSGTNQVMYSDDEGENWNSVPVELSGWNAITSINNRLVSVAYYGTNRVMYSDFICPPKKILDDGTVSMLAPLVVVDAIDDDHAVSKGQMDTAITAANGSGDCCDIIQVKSANTATTEVDLSLGNIVYINCFQDTYVTITNIVVGKKYTFILSCNAAPPLTVSFDPEAFRDTSGTGGAIDDIPLNDVFISKNHVVLDVISVTIDYVSIRRLPSVNGSVGPFLKPDGSVDLEAPQIGVDAVLPKHLTTLEQVEGLIDPPLLQNNWIAVNVEPSYWSSITKINSRLVAVANSGTNRVMYSDDQGETWTYVTTEVSSWNCIVEINGRLVAVASSGTNRVMYSDDQGETWTYVTTEVSSWNSITQINSRLVAVAQTGTNKVMYSDDEGETWTYVAGVGSSWRSITKINSRLVAVGNTSNIMYSDDQAGSWTLLSVSIANLTEIVTINSRLVAISYSSVNQVMYSDDDGDNWTYVATEDSSWNSSVVVNNELIVIAGYGTYPVMYSIDEGETWTYMNAIAYSWKAMTVIGSRIVAVSSDGSDQVMYNDFIIPPKPILDDGTVSMLAPLVVVDAIDDDHAVSKGQMDTAITAGSFSGDYNDLSNKPDLSAFDNVDTYANLAAFPATGVSDVFYIANDTGLMYRWSVSAYVLATGNLALGETSATAYRGDRGKAAYDHSQSTSGNPHNVTKANVGLGSANNTTDLEKPISTLTAAALLTKLTETLLKTTQRLFESGQGNKLFQIQSVSGELNFDLYDGNKFYAILIENTKVNIPSNLRGQNVELLLFNDGGYAVDFALGIEEKGDTPSTIAGDYILVNMSCWGTGKPVFAVVTNQNV